MTALYAFIATKTTYDIAIPSIARDQMDFNRRVSGAFSALAGGTLKVGEIRFWPLSSAVPNHLLCDGTVLNMIDFPELSDYLGNTFGGDGITTFALPDYVNEALATAPTSPVQVIEGGTVSTGDPVTVPDTSGETGGTTGGNRPSGSRPVRQGEGVIP